MCMTLPARVVALDPLGATVETEGRPSHVSTVLEPDVGVGDWVLVSAGTVVRRLEPGQADEIRRTLLEAMALEDAEASEAGAAVEGR